VKWNGDFQIAQAILARLDNGGDLEIAVPFLFQVRLDNNYDTLA